MKFNGLHFLRSETAPAVNPAVSPSLAIDISLPLGHPKFSERPTKLRSQCVTELTWRTDSGATTPASVTKEYLDFDVSYYYKRTPPRVNSLGSDPARAEGVAIRPCSLLEPQHLTLIPLSAARRRDDIRTRREAFELGGDLETARPDVTRAAMLISLEDAFARDDIRRRVEGFELMSVAWRPELYSVPYSNIGTFMCQGDQPVDHRISVPQSPASTIPSIYSMDSWEGDAITVPDVRGASVAPRSSGCIVMTFDDAARPTPHAQVDRCR